MTDFAIDESTEFGARAAAHLRDDEIVWMTTVTPSGAPLPSPVWFLWRGGDEVLALSKPTSPRIRNIAANPKVALNFRGTKTGDDVVMFSATAVAGEAVTPDEWEAYVAKYATGIANLDMTPESFVAEYLEPVRMRLGKLRGY